MKTISPSDFNPMNAVILFLAPTVVYFGRMDLNQKWNLANDSFAQKKLFVWASLIQNLSYIFTIYTFIHLLLTDPL